MGMWPLLFSAPACQPERRLSSTSTTRGIDPEGETPPADDPALVLVDAGNSNPDTAANNDPEPDAGNPPADVGDNPPNEIVPPQPENFNCETIEARGAIPPWAIQCTWDRYETNNPEVYNYKIERKFNNGNYENFHNLRLGREYNDFDIIPGFEYQYRVRLEHRPPLTYSEWRESDPVVLRVRPQYDLTVESAVIHGNTSTEEIYERYSQCLDPAAHLFNYNQIEDIEYFEGQLCQQDRDENIFYSHVVGNYYVAINKVVGEINFTYRCGGYIGNTALQYYRFSLLQKRPPAPDLYVLNLHLFPEHDGRCYAIWNELPLVGDEDQPWLGMCLADSEKIPGWRLLNCELPYDALLRGLALYGLDTWVKTLNDLPEFNPEIFEKAALVIAMAVAIYFGVAEVAALIEGVAGGEAAFAAMIPFVDANDLRDRAKAMVEFIQRTFATLTPESDAFDKPDEADTNVIIRDVQGIPGMPLAVDERADISIIFRNTGQAGMFNYRIEQNCSDGIRTGENEVSNIYIPKNAEIIKHTSFRKDNESECEYIVSALTDAWEDENLDIQGTVTDTRNYNLAVQGDEEDCNLVIESAELEGGRNKRIGDELVLDINIRNIGGSSEAAYYAHMDNFGEEGVFGCNWNMDPTLARHDDAIHHRLQGCFADVRGDWFFAVHAVCDAERDADGFIVGRITDSTPGSFTVR